MYYAYKYIWKAKCFYYFNIPTTFLFFYAYVVDNGCTCKDLHQVYITFDLPNSDNKIASFVYLLKCYGHIMQVFIVQS